MRLVTAATVILLCAISARAQGAKPAKQTKEQPADAYRLSATPTTVYAHGKWVEVSEKKESQSFFGGVVELKCSKSEMLCYDMEALITAGRPSIVVTELPILKWNGTEIIASEEDSAICLRQTLTINFRTREVTMVDSPKLPLPESCTALAGEAATRANTYRLVATEFPDIGDAGTP